MNHLLFIIILISTTLFGLILGSATSGEQFKGLPFRSFRHELKFQSLPDSNTYIQPPGDIICEQWCVVTTINEPTEAVLQHAKFKPDWCLIVVGDIKSPENYHIPSCDTCVYLDKHAQIEYLKLFEEFGNRTPWNHFGRKNVGYLYAIHHGAQRIWDFDDDNQLIGKMIEFPNHHDHVEIVHLSQHGIIINPYIHMNASTFPIWPRGFPIQDVREKTLFNFNTHKLSHLLDISIVVLQSLADHDPDVDAIYRMTQPIPVVFQPHHDKKRNILIIPQTTFVPINAQSCLFDIDAFWMLLLPVSIHGRVSDIWRGYLGQRILHETGHHVAFSSPFVIQNRNVHSYIKDFDAELPLYQETSALVHFLHHYNTKHDHLPGLYESLLVGMFERGFIEETDVLLGQMWIQSLYHIGYVFPMI